MFSIQIFAEIFVVGALLVLAASPIIIRLSPASQKSALGSITGSVKDAPLTVAVIVILVYTIGIAGNRLVNDLFDDVLSIDPGTSVQSDFLAWATKSGADVKSLKQAEFRLLQDEGARIWLDRHKSFVRVLRAASFASAFFILAMLAYRASKPKLKRYTAVHFIASCLLFAMFSTAYWSESHKYKEHVAGIYKALHPK